MLQWLGQIYQLSSTFWVGEEEEIALINPPDSWMHQYEMGDVLNLTEVTTFGRLEVLILYSPNF